MSTQTDPRPSPFKRVARPARRVLLIGWDAADWRMIHPLLEAGKMPALQGLIERGTSGNLASLRPMLSPILWNTIATGHRADRHGVLGFTEPLPDGSNIRPVASTSRKCRALWNMLTLCGLRTNVVGWYASHPAEPILGTMVSNRFEQAVGGLGDPWPVPPGAVHPPALAAELEDLRVHPGELVDPTVLLPFIPSGLSYDVLSDPHARALLGLIAQTTSIHAVATHLMANTEWDFTAIYYEGIDRAGHEFMEFHPPCQPGIDPVKVERYQHCMTGMYRYHDLMLKTLLDLAGDDTAVMLISDHGYYSDHRRPDPATAGPVDWHRQFGIGVLAGPGIAPGQRLGGASLLDVAPTVLDLLGLPAGADMPGRAWAEAYVGEGPDAAAPEALSRILSWDSVPGEDGRHAVDATEDPEAAREALQQLIDLGYIDPPSDDVKQTVEQTKVGNQVNLATNLLEGQRYREALAILEPFARDPRWRAGLTSLCLQAHLALRQFDEARAVIRAHAESGAEASRTAWLESTVALAENRLQAVVDGLDPAIFPESSRGAVALRRGQALVGLSQWEAADESFVQALAAEPDQAQAWAGRAAAALGRERYQEVVERGLHAVGLIWTLPRAHYYLGTAWMELGESARAVDALRVCLNQAPGHLRAMRRLTTLLRADGQNAEADQLQLRARQMAEARNRLEAEADASLD